MDTKRANMRNLDQRGELSGSVLPRPHGVCTLVADIDSATGGVQKQTRRLLGDLSRAGVQTFVCSRNYRNRPRSEYCNGMSIHRSPTVPRRLHAVNSMIYWFDGLVWLIRNRKKYDIIQCQQMFGATILGLLAKLVLGKPVVVRVTLTGPELGEVYYALRMPLSRIYRRLAQRVDRWIALTSEMKHEILMLGINPDRVTIIPNSAPLPAAAAYDLEARARYRSYVNLPYARVAVFSGRLSEEKGVIALLHAWGLLFPRHPDAHLLLLGEGGAFRNVEVELRALRATLGLEHVVHFLGHIDNVTDYLLASDMFVLPTRAEGMSNSLVEAMAAGSTIVTTDIGANRDLVEHEVNALLIRADDVDGLSAAMSRILDDSELANRLGLSAREKAARLYSHEANTASYLDVYSQIMHRVTE